MTTFLALRIFGPCSSAELSRRVGTDRYTVMVAAEALARHGMAQRTPGGSWDITEKGKTSIDPTLRARSWAAEAVVRLTRKWPYERGRAS